MPATYEPIATTTLSSPATQIDFTSIPNTYTDLRIVFVGTTSSTGYVVRVRFNGDSGNNYSSTYIDGTSAGSAGSSRYSNVQRLTAGQGFTSTTELNLVTYDIFSYAGSTNKSTLFTQQQDNNGTGAVAYNVGLWRNTAAITTIRLFTDDPSVNFITGSRATLYGIKAA